MELSSHCHKYVYRHMMERLYNNNNSNNCDHNKLHLYELIQEDFEQMLHQQKNRSDS